MTPEAQHEAIKEMFRREERRLATMTPEERKADAIARLQRDGIITDDLDLTPEYGGPPRAGEPDERPPQAMVEQALDRAKRDPSPASLAKAASWIERAAELGHAPAFIQMAKWRLSGTHYPVDREQAGKILGHAIALDSAEARILHFWLIEKGMAAVPDPRETYLDALAGAVAGDKDSREFMARLLELGFGTKRDIAAAAIWRGRQPEMGH